MARYSGREFADYIKAKHAQKKTHVSALAKAGKFCPACRYVHPYTGSTTPGSNILQLNVKYEKRGKANVLIWLCPFSGDNLGEIWLGGTSGG